MTKTFTSQDRVAWRDLLRTNQTVQRALREAMKLAPSAYDPNANKTTEQVAHAAAYRQGYEDYHKALLSLAHDENFPDETPFLDMADKSEARATGI